MGSKPVSTSAFSIPGAFLAIRSQSTRDIGTMSTQHYTNVTDVWTTLDVPCTNVACSLGWESLPSVVQTSRTFRLR